MPDARSPFVVRVVFLLVATVVGAGVLRVCAPTAIAVETAAE
ncbi:hypothetical protein [Sandaracinus amylolyticus]|nr:hypothetical protein [Sandaracinus amylolyticus]UJR85735.1 Hypothetical protein I5071_78150 [Sandaracinus amylolyticus]